MLAELGKRVNEHSETVNHIKLACYSLFIRTVHSSCLTTATAYLSSICLHGGMNSAQRHELSLGGDAGRSHETHMVLITVLNQKPYFAHCSRHLFYDFKIHQT